MSDYDYRTLTRIDTVGARPNLESSPYLAKLNEMTGLRLVKEKIMKLMTLQLQNYDAEMRGEKIQLISLHRVFYGNPGKYIELLYDLQYLVATLLFIISFTPHIFTLIDFYFI